MVAATGRRRGAGLVTVLILAVALVFLVLVGTIYYYSWLHGDPPKGLLVVEGGPGYEGAHVLVKSLAADVFEGVLTPAGNYTVRVGLDPGIYSLRVWRGAETFCQRSEFDLNEYQRITLTLKPPGPPTRPANP